MPKPTLHSALELEVLVQQMGFLPFFPCFIPNFSIEEFTPSRYWFVDGLWEWRMELARWGTPEESRERMICHLEMLCPEALDDGLDRLIR